MSTLPLITHHDPDGIVAWCDSLPVSASRFLGEVDRIADLLPPGRHALNLCVNRYRFTVALAACILNGQVSLLPSTYTQEMIRQMRRIAPDAFCIADQDVDGIDLPLFHYPSGEGSLTDTAIPDIDCDQLIAYVFTSGSTGTPVPHVKRWGSLARNARREAARFGISHGYSLVGTVPAQHMYGLESTVMMPLQCVVSLYATRPFYPADICAALAALPHPRALVTTPYHLRTLLAEQAFLPTLDLLLSATAPLSQELAAEAEARFRAPLFEIYGCTETGLIASRRTTSGATWETFAGIQLHCESEAIWAQGGDIEATTPLCDVIELIELDPTRFLLQGRHADVVNIAGKRTSLGYLNHQLNAIPGVRDGIFLLPPDDEKDREGVRRLIALVVAPGLMPDTLMQALRERIDPVFLPRPLLFADNLPRNAVGKLSDQAKQTFLARLGPLTAH